MNGMSVRPCCCIRMRLINARRLTLLGFSRGQSTRRQRGEISTWRPRGRESKRAVPPFTFQTAAVDLVDALHGSMIGDGSNSGRRFCVYWRVVVRCVGLPSQGVKIRLFAASRAAAAAVRPGQAEVIFQSCVVVQSCACDWTRNVSASLKV